MKWWELVCWLMWMGHFRRSAEGCPVARLPKSIGRALLGAKTRGFVSELDYPGRGRVVYVNRKGIDAFLSWMKAERVEEEKAELSPEWLARLRCRFGVGPARPVERLSAKLHE